MDVVVVVTVPVVFLQGCIETRVAANAAKADCFSGDKQNTIQKRKKISAGKKTNKKKKPSRISHIARCLHCAVAVICCFWRRAELSSVRSHVSDQAEVNRSISEKYIVIVATLF